MREQRLVSRGRCVTAASVLALVLGLVALNAVTAAVGAGSVPPPMFGKLVVVVPVSGKVYVTAPGRPKAVLSAGRRVQVGSVVDASRGTVRLTAADSNGAPTYSGEFSQGEFKVLQSRTGDGTTEVVLVGTACTKPAAARDGRRATIARRPHPHIRRFLQITADGKFVIVGANARAVELGPAEWSITDECDGTHINDKKGKVQARSKRSSNDLFPGESLITYCHAARVPSFYCIGLDAIPGAEVYGFNLVTQHQRQLKFEVCFASGTRTAACHAGRIRRTPDGDQGRIICLLNQKPGTYLARWLLGGRPVGIALRFTEIQPISPLGPESRCMDSPQ